MDAAIRNIKPLCHCLEGHIESNILYMLWSNTKGSCNVSSDIPLIQLTDGDTHWW